MKTILLKFYTPILFSLFFIITSGWIGWLSNPENPVAFYEVGGGLDYITYLAYGIGIFVALFFWRDFIGTDKQKSYFAFLFLGLITLLREMGAQHWLTEHDTTAIKIRFFTNPNNPLSEKIVAGFIIVVVVLIALWLLIKYLPKMLKGFFTFNPLYWTIATFGGLGVFSQCADRLPSNYFKATGERLNEMTLWLLKIIEESGEVCLPLLFGLAFIQYHLLINQKKRLMRFRRK